MQVLGSFTVGRGRTQVKCGGWALPLAVHDATAAPRAVNLLVLGWLARARTAFSNQLT